MDRAKAEAELREFTDGMGQLATREGYLSWLMSWLDRHSGVEVSREQIDEIFCRHVLIDIAIRDPLLDDLYALIHGKEKRWCEHCSQEYNQKYSWSFRGPNQPRSHWEYISDDWKFCPVCGAKRSGD